VRDAASQLSTRGGGGGDFARLGFAAALPSCAAARARRLRAQAGPCVDARAAPQVVFTLLRLALVRNQANGTTMVPHVETLLLFFGEDGMAGPSGGASEDAPMQPPYMQALEECVLAIYQVRPRRSNTCSAPRHDLLLDACSATSLRLSAHAFSAQSLPRSAG
jgi:hypothetical protein